jgi:hypothetical protein
MCLEWKEGRKGFSEQRTRLIGITSSIQQHTLAGAEVFLIEQILFIYRAFFQKQYTSHFDRSQRKSPGQVHSLVDLV